MKPSLATIIAALALFAGPPLRADTIGDRLIRLGDRVVVVKKGTARPMTSETALSNGSRVRVDGTLVSKSGSRRTLKDCESIGFDGSRISDKENRIVMIDGQVMVMKGGVTRRLEIDTKLGNGRTVTQDGVVMDRNGSRMELKEGQIMAMNGQTTGGSFEQAKRNIGSGR